MSNMADADDQKNDARTSDHKDASLTDRVGKEEILPV